MIADVFCGMGGWSAGAAQAGVGPIVGLDLDPWACTTHAAAGFGTIRTDVTAYPASRFRGRLYGLTISPPCTDWTVAGLRRRTAGPSGRLVEQVIRWAVEARPVWIAAEQVPTVRPVWRAFAEALGRIGYHCWTGALNAADYGVPQLRRRAFLLAHLGAQPHPPVPTHAAVPSVSLGGTVLARHVYMAEALGWDANDYPEAEWARLRPATTVLGEPRIARPRKYGGGSQSFGATRVTLEELLVLQFTGPPNG